MRRTIALPFAAALAAIAAPASAQPGTEECSTRTVMDAFIPMFFEQRNAKDAFEEWVHPDYINHNPMAVVDIFRVEGCKIVEHWDVVQQVPERSMNDNGMF